MKNFKLVLSVLAVTSMVEMAGQSPVLGQSFVEYIFHPISFGDHEVPTDWPDGPSPISVTLDSDETVLHDDGIGQSQRTGELDEVYDPDDDGPQGYDNPALINMFGPRLPLLQHNTANGTSTVSYEFSTAVNERVNLILIDIDSGDDVTVRAFDIAGNPVDMLQWTLAAEGDLSLIRNTGTAFSTIVAELPTVTFNTDGIRLWDVNLNFSRSYSVLRAPGNANLGRIDIEFTGQISSPSRTNLGGSSHIYVGLATAVSGALGDLNLDGEVTFLDIPNFIQLLSDGGFQAEADFDQDGDVGFQDIQPFIDVLSGVSGDG